jgi:hypothetical protein
LLGIFFVPLLFVTIQRFTKGRVEAPVASDASGRT